LLPTVASKVAPTREVANQLAPTAGITEIPVIGVRRVIAQRMEQAKRTAPHFAYVEEVDVTALEALRLHLNARRPRDEAYSYLPFVMAALARVLRDFPQCNAHYDAARNVVLRHAAVHIGVATQTPDGLKVPVVRHVEALTLAQVAAEVGTKGARVACTQQARSWSSPFVCASLYCCVRHVDAVVPGLPALSADADSRVAPSLMSRVFIRLGIARRYLRICRATASPPPRGHTRRLPDAPRSAATPQRRTLGCVLPARLCVPLLLLPLGHSGQPPLAQKTEKHDNNRAAQP
jgi:hypothetical protein